MTLPAGTRLGPYEVLSPIGKGGMGEVYRANDSRLAREVAIKVLPAALATDQERLRRFEREARSASALNHQNIVTIYDIGSANDISYIAMELVDGVTLRELMLSGPLQTKKLLQIAPQIAEGLARAHEAGITHRDLKPENVMVKKDGLVKILDFGLAKLSSNGSGSDGASQLPTMTGTQPGIVVGTVSYMSPEQASGQALDFRSDQFSLGSMLYEMATGRRAFQRKTAVETLAAILNDEPDPVAKLKPQVPAQLTWIIDRCFAKDPEARYASTRDLARDLESTRDRVSALVEGPSKPVSKRGPYALALVVSAPLAVAAGVLVLGRWVGDRPPPTFQRVTFGSATVGSARFGPDGRTVVYTAWDFPNNQPTQVFEASPGHSEARAVSQPGASLDSISSRGEMLLARGRDVFRASLAGGAERQLFENVRGSAWAPNGTDIAIVRQTDKVRLEFPVGTVLYETSGRVSNIRVSPSSKLVAFVHHPVRGDSRGSVVVVDAKGNHRNLSREFGDIAGLAWSAKGDEVWFSAKPTDSGAVVYAVTLASRERVVWQGPGDQLLQDVFADGRVILLHRHNRRVLMVFTPSEDRERDLAWLDQSFLADLANDGKTVLFTEEGEGTGGLTYSVYMRRTDGSPAIRLGDGLACGLSPDGRWVLAIREDSKSSQLVLIPTGAGDTRVLTHDAINHRAGAWFPDGKHVLFLGYEPGRGDRLYVQDLDGTMPRAISPEAKGRIELDSAWHPMSPDGRRIVWFDGEGYVVQEVDGGPPRPVAGLTGNLGPIGWSSDGLTLFAQSVDGRGAKVFRLDPATGEKHLWKELAGLRMVQTFLITPDGETYAYGYSSSTQDLYLAQGLR